MSTPRPRLGSVFRGGPPDRSDGLQGLLPPARPSSDEPQPSTEDTAATPPQSPPPRGHAQPDAAEERSATDRADAGVVEPATAGERPSSSTKAPARQRKAGRARPGRPANSSTQIEDQLRVVPVSVDVTVHSQLKDFSVQINRPFASIVLEAIEDTADALSETWSSAAAPESGRFFVRRAAPQQRRRRREPAMQVLLRMDARDADTLDQLVTDWSAPSRSALVTEALRRYLAHRGH